LNCIDIIYNITEKFKVISLGKHLLCVWMTHFYNTEKLKWIVFELLAIKFSSFSK